MFDSFDVSVAEVVALASHIPISASEIETPVEEIVFEFSPIDKKIVDTDVEQWIESVTANVEARLTRLSSLPKDLRLPLVKSGRDVVLNGAAHYLVAAGAPLNAATNDMSSYSAVLWERYKSGLDYLEKAAQDTLEIWEKQNGGLVYSFPETYFPDNRVW